MEDVGSGIRFLLWCRPHRLMSCVTLGERQAHSEPVSSSTKRSNNAHRAWTRFSEGEGDASGALAVYKVLGVLMNPILCSRCYPRVTDEKI